VVALSIAEAEYIALSTATQDVVWLRRLQQELGVHMEKPTIIMEDNQGATAIAQDPVNHSKTNIDIRHHYVREAIQDGIITREYCSKTEMVADLLTKPLPKVQFQKLRELMGVHEREVGSED
jgi:hypothetical protein